MRIIRVFPRRTRATPTDDLVYTGEPDLFAEADEVHVSVAFTWDLPRAEQLVDSWRHVAETKLGGPALDEPAGDFVSGRYLRPGYVITSRGCPNRCWFCSAWRREGNTVRELPIENGWNVLDDNLLACSDQHIRSVFSMLARQPRAPQFTGGLEAARLRPWHCEALRALRPKQVFFAYDTPDDLEPLRQAGRLMLDAGFSRASHALRCYVLCGFPHDSLPKAEGRLRQASEAGFTPMAMLWRNIAGCTTEAWRGFQRQWARPTIIHATHTREVPA